MLQHDMAADQATAKMIRHHTLAIGYSPFYLTENADGIRQERPHNESRTFPSPMIFTLGLDVHTELHHYDNYCFNKSCCR